MTSKHFYEMVELVANERNLDINDVLEKVIVALKKACGVQGYTGDIQVELNEEKKRIRIFEFKYVVAEIDPEGVAGQITLEEGRLIKENAKIGTKFKKEINIEKDFSRTGARHFLQIFNQGVKELQRIRNYEFFKARENEMISTTISSIGSEYIILNIGLECQATMPIKEALPGEELKVGDSIKVYITKVEETTKGPKVFVSRVHKDIVKRLFELNIPEVASGVIEIMGISRDPGSRTKIGVKSNNEMVDPKGACVGMGGVRIKQINNALNGERVDIFNWSDNPINLIAEALTPARVISVLVDEKEHKSLVIVPDDQFSLAIGKGGQNARLASQVSGWKIDIKNESTAYKEGLKFKPNVTVK
jgi:N utilization substance protein A